MDNYFNFGSLKRGRNTVWDVPTTGELSFELSAGDVILGEDDDTSNDTACVERIMRRSRMVLEGRRKTIAILSHVKNNSQ